MFAPPKFCISIVFIFSLSTYDPTRNWKQCLCKIILEGQTKNIMVFLILANSVVDWPFQVLRIIAICTRSFSIKVYIFCIGDRRSSQIRNAVSFETWFCHVRLYRTVFFFFFFFLKKLKKKKNFFFFFFIIFFFFFLFYFF